MALKSVIHTLFIGMKLITRFINIVLISSCVFHVGNIVNDILNPNLPEISVYKKDLKDIEFPLSFLICIDQLVNADFKYKEVGYENKYRFFIAESIHNKSIIGWRGHMKNGSTYDTVEGFVIS